MKMGSAALFALCLLAACQPADNTFMESKFELPTASTELIALVPNINPEQLKIGDIRKPFCAEVVTVQNPEIACQQSDCKLKAFYSEVMPVVAGQRAVRISDCGRGQVKDHLLTDREPRFNSTAVLLLQKMRDGENLWRQLQEGNDLKIELATEAAEGVLSLNAQGSYEWEELPD